LQQATLVEKTEYFLALIPWLVNDLALFSPEIWKNQEKLTATIKLFDIPKGLAALGIRGGNYECPICLSGYV
jgi:hypothetical protein